MAVRIRMKKLGRRHRPFFRICAIDGRKPRDGRVIEELGHYDPMVRETDARAILKSERVDYWLSVGAQPSDKVKVLIAKYGTDGTHLEQQAAALERLKMRPQAPAPVAVALPSAEPEAPAEAATSEEAPAASGDEASAEAPAEDAPVEAAPAEEAAAAEGETAAAEETKESE